MKLRNVAWVAGCVVWVAACSSSSEDNGSAGSSGSAGSGASAGTGGSGGGNAGASGTAGSAGSAGASGEAGSGGGGAAGTAGSGGGTSGAAGNGGSGGGTTTPRCDDLCADIVAADCSEGPTEAGCLLTCKALTSSSACNDVANEYFDCTDAATIECNAQNEPVAPGCGVQYLVAIDCAVNENPNPAIVVPCEDYCGNIADQSCPGNGTEEDCNTNCLWLGATGTGCDDEWSAYLDCANAATWSCILGYAVPAGCGSEWQAYRACIDTAGGV